MLRQVYSKESVVDAAQKRIAYIFDEFENITKYYNYLVEKNDEKPSRRPQKAAFGSIIK